MKNTAFRIVTMILTVAFFISVCTFEPFNLNGKGDSCVVFPLHKAAD